MKIGFVIDFDKQQSLIVGEAKPHSILKHEFLLFKTDMLANIERTWHFLNELEDNFENVIFVTLTLF